MFMKFKHLYALVALMTGSLLVGCHSDIDLDNIDTQAEVEMGVALPIGSIHATIGDFFGQGFGNFYIDSADNQGVITWKDTFHVERDFHDASLDLTNMISSKKLSLNLYDILISKGALVAPDGKIYIPGNDSQQTIQFAMPIKLNGINKELGGERLDSALIEMARFTSQIQDKNIDLDWNWIDEISIDLGDQVTRPDGKVMMVYTQGEAGGYGQDIKTDIDKFTICLMKNAHLDPKTQYDWYDHDNVIDSCTFKINFKFTIPSGQMAVISQDGGFDYNLDVAFIRYTAIWGKFKQSSQMYDEAVLDLSDSWGDLAWISQSNVPFADPKIDMHIVTKVAGAMKIDGDYLFAVDNNGDSTYAEFVRSGQTYRNFPKQFEVGEYLDPITSTIGDSSTNMIINFSNNPKEGSIDKLFRNMPQKLGYKFNVDFNYQMTPQVRIVPNTGVRINAICTLPMIFNKGIFLSYSDTIRDVNLSQYALDSLVADIAVIDSLKSSELKVIIKAQNEIPLDIYATLRFYDKSGNLLMDPSDPSKPLSLFQQDTLQFVAPTYEYASGSWQMVKKGETAVVAEVTQEKLNMLPQVDHIVYYAQIDDRSLAYAYEKGIFNVKLTDDAGLTLKIALTAKTDAYLNLDFNTK